MFEYITVDDNFAVAFVAGNVDMNSRVKTNSFKSPSLVQVLNLFVKIYIFAHFCEDLYICTLHTESQLCLLSQFNLLHSFFLFFHNSRK